MFRNAIAYHVTRGNGEKETIWAMPGSQLHKLLSEGKKDAAHECHRESVAREKELMARIDAQMAKVQR